jgi:hypothetical protein
MSHLTTLPRLRAVLCVTAKIRARCLQWVESRMGAVAWGLWPTPRFPSPLIKPDVRISRIRLSDWLHLRHTERTGRARLLLGTCLSFASRQSILRWLSSLNGVCRLIANHRDLAIFEGAPEVRALSSAGITRPHRSYDPVRLPRWPPPYATLRPLPSPPTGLPRLPEPPF